MCGIAGLCDYTQKSTELNVREMTRSLSHRGPDDEGVHFWDFNKYSVGFGHRRLSIIDTSSAGHQPMFSSCNRYCIVFNGEIYNYKEIRQNLIVDGFSFQTNTDTEVLLYMYQKHGKSFIKEVKGMFAMVIFDMVSHQVAAFRDRMGVKPLYYYWKDDLFLFGSELKALLAHPKFQKNLDINSVGEFFKYGYIGEKSSIFHNVKKLEKGHCMTLDLTEKKIDIFKYWDIHDFYKLPKFKMDSAEILQDLKNQFIKAFKYRMVSDVPVGVFLSGGYDSTLLSAILSNEIGEKLTTFTIGFEEDQYNEAPLARKISNILGTNHHEYYCTEHEARQMVDLLPTVYDEPFSDPSAIPTLLVCQKAVTHVKVVLSADGGDESFAGYNRYLSYYNKIKMLQTSSNLTRNVAKNILSIRQLNPSIRNNLNIVAGNYSNYFSNVSTHINDNDIKRMLKGFKENDDAFEEESLDSIDQILLWDLDHYLPDNVLTKIDRASMSMGLESREPFLDHNLLEFAAQIPFDLKLHQGVQKYLIRQLVHQYISPEIIDLPKKGFAPPLNKWLKSVFEEEYRTFTSQNHLTEQGIFDHEYYNKSILNIKVPYLQDRVKWSMFMFQKWHQKWMS